VPSGCRKALEECLAGGFFIQMHRLWVKFGRKTLDFRSRYLGFTRLELHSDGKIIEPRDRRHGICPLTGTFTLHHKRHCQDVVQDSSGPRPNLVSVRIVPRQYLSNVVPALPLGIWGRRSVLSRNVRRRALSERFAFQQAERIERARKLRLPGLCWQIAN